MYCAKCGANINETDRVCPNCSSPVTQAHSIRMSAAIPPVQTHADMGRVEAPQPVKAKPDKNSSKAAVRGMVFGILSMFASWGGMVLVIMFGRELAPMVTLLGGTFVVFGLMSSLDGLRDCKEKGKNGKAFAIIGMVCCLISLMPLLLLYRVLSRT